MRPQIYLQAYKAIFDRFLSRTLPPLPPLVQHQKFSQHIYLSRRKIHLIEKMHRNLQK